MAKCKHWGCEVQLPYGSKKKFCSKECMDKQRGKKIIPSDKVNESGEMIFNFEAYSKNLFAI